MNKLALLFVALAATVTRAETYSQWAASFGLSGGNAAANADPDNDGFPNLLEYSLEGFSPLVVESQNHASYPRAAYVRRTGNALGAWEFASFASPPSNGVNGVWHFALMWVANADVEGVRYTPQVSDSGTLRKWYDGRCAFRVETLPGNTVMAVCLPRGNRHERMFLRLGVALDANVGSSLAGLTVGGLSAAALDVGSTASSARVISGSTTATVDTQDIRVLRTTGATSVTDFVWPWTPGKYNVNPVVVTRESSNDSILAPHPSDPYRWTWQGNGSATLRLRTQTAVYAATVTASTATGATVDVWQANIAGSLRAHLDATMDARFAGKTAAAKAIYSTQDHATPTYVRNASCWAAGADLTPISPWNSSGGSHMAGILVSPRHVIFATHYAPATGATIRFIKADGTVVTRTITAKSALTQTASYYPDITVGVLDSDVASGITFARVLPASWATKIPTLSNAKRVAALLLDQEEKALTADWLSTTGSAPYMTAFTRPVDVQRQVFYEDIVSGDSGNPACLIVNNQLVLLTVWTYGGAGSGTDVAAFTSAINSAMTSLGGGYQLTAADLSAFTSY